MAKDTGGSAFPVNEAHQCNPDGGMTLRDYFAINCKEVSILSTHEAENLIGEKWPSDFPAQILWSAKVDAALRYISADAMIAERAK